MVFDGTISLENNDIFPSTPVRVELKDGYVSTITGGLGAAGLRKAIESGESEAPGGACRRSGGTPGTIGEFGNRPKP